MARRNTDGGKSWAHVAVVVLSCCGLAACHSPVAPEALGLKRGTNMLTVTGFDAGDPGYPLCGPVFVPPVGKNVDTLVDLQLVGSEWTARSISPGATIELRIHPAGTSTFGSLVTGTIKGVAPDVSLGSTPPRNVFVVLGTLAQPIVNLEGTVTPVGSLIMGTMTGSISFSDSAGNLGSCSTIEFLLKPLT